MSGSFIRTSARVICILQLCLAFSTLLWILSGPFLGDYVRNKSSLLLFQAVVGESSIEGRPQRDRLRFLNLPETQRVNIERAYKNLEEHMGRAFGAKMRESVIALLFKISPLTQIWLILSISLPIMLLRRSERAIPAVWLIPAVVLAFAVDNHWHGQLPDERLATLFPKEAQLASDLPLSEAWQHYIVDNWSADNGETFDRRLETGEHAFRTAWLEMQLQTTPLGHNAKRSFFVLVLYMLWNLTFAVVIWKTLRRPAHAPDFA